jgi:hypothetical protein
MRIRLILLVTALGLSLLLVACGDDDSPEETASPTETAIGSPDATEAPAETDAASPAPTSESSLPQGWSDLAPIGTPRSEVAVAELNGVIYVIGGFEASGNTSALVEAYDTAADSWSGVSPLPVALHHAAAASANGKLYVLGGFTSDYDPVATAYE